MASKTDNRSTVGTEWPFGKTNYIVFGIALVVIIVGYILLGQNDITMAPLLLVIGYCVLIPIAIMIKNRSGESSAPVADESEAQE